MIFSSCKSERREALLVLEPLALSGIIGRGAFLLGSSGF